MADSRNDTPHLVDATILFIDLMNSVSLSNSLTLLEYNELINDYQSVLSQVLEIIQDRYSVGEYYLGGDQLAVFFYDPEDVSRRRQIARLRKRSPGSRKADEIERQMNLQKSRCLYGALRCAVQAKNAWVRHSRNIARIHSQQPVMDLGVGINTGPVVLQQRGDGRARIEGFAINYAKRVEGFSRHGQYCKIMLSRTAYETFRNTVVGPYMLKQRAFFEPYVPQPGTLKGLQMGTKVFELKFFHRLDGFSIPAEQVAIYDQIFKGDPTNIWAYTNLVNYYLYDNDDVESAQKYAHRALYSNPENEKIYFDLAKINIKREEYATAKEYCLLSIKRNHDMEIAFDALADIEYKLEGDWQQVLRDRAKALALSPESAAYHIDLAAAMARLGQLTEAQKHYDRAKALYAGIRDFDPEYIASLEKMLEGKP